MILLSRYVILSVCSAPVAAMIYRRNRPQNRIMSRIATDAVLAHILGILFRTAVSRIRSTQIDHNI